MATLHGCPGLPPEPAFRIRPFPWFPAGKIYFQDGQVGVKRPDLSWNALRAWIRPYRVQLALTLRMTIAAVLGLVLAQALSLPMPLFTVLTALIVTQMSVGRSLKTSVDYLVGTIGGTAYGGALALLIPHASEGALLGVLVLAVAPLALVAAIKRNLNAVPVSSIIVVLMPAITHASPLDAAINRVYEVGLGVVVGLLVTFLVLPAGAHRQARAVAARTLDLLAQSLGMTLSVPAGHQDRARLAQIYDTISLALSDLITSAAEGEQERSARLSAEPDASPLRRTLQRLRHDCVMIGRAVEEPMPDDMQARLAAPLAAFGTAAAGYMNANAAALLVRRPPPDEAALDQAHTAAVAEMAVFRQEGLTRNLSDELAGRFFALAFALEQIRRNLGDLGNVVAEQAVPA